MALLATDSAESLSVRGWGCASVSVFLCRTSQLTHRLPRAFCLPCFLLSPPPGAGLDALAPIVDGSAGICRAGADHGVPAVVGPPHRPHGGRGKTHRARQRGRCKAGVAGAKVADGTPNILRLAAAQAGGRTQLVGGRVLSQSQFKQPRDLDSFIH